MWPLTGDKDDVALVLIAVGAIVWVVGMQLGRRWQPWPAGRWALDMSGVDHGTSVLAAAAFLVGLFLPALRPPYLAAVFRPPYHQAMDLDRPRAWPWPDALDARSAAPQFHALLYEDEPSARTRRESPAGRNGAGAHPSLGRGP